MNQQDTRSNFRSSLCFLKELPETNFPNEFERIYSLNPQLYSFSIESFNNILREIQEQASTFLEKFEEFDITASGPNFINDITSFNSNFSLLNMLVAPNVSFDPQLVFGFLITFSKGLRDILINFIPFFHFDYTYDNPFPDDLKKYMDRGDIIGLDVSYQNSPLQHLEDAISGGREAVKKYLGKEAISSDTDRLEKIFFAFVAPSFEGKTQSAFVFRRIKPLYFLFTENQLNVTETLQPIYGNFIKLSNIFRKAIQDDLVVIDNTNSKLTLFEKISASNLANCHSDTKFLTLGFIVALINQARQEYPHSTKSWMEYFVTTSRKMQVHGVSLDDLFSQGFVFGEFFLFLDEFDATNWAIFARNLARAANIRVLVSNTNTNVANLIGKSQHKLSRTESDFGWSIVNLRSNSINLSILNRIHPTIQGHFKSIVTKVSRTNPNEARIIEGFFQNFIKVQLKSLRPGFADLICEAVKEIRASLNLTLNLILEKVVNSLAASIVSKKESIVKENEALLGTFALFMNNSYLLDDKDIDAIDLAHRKVYLKDHFYYLLNPVDQRKSYFLVYPSATTQENLGTGSLRFKKKDDISSRFFDWDVEYTYFKFGELIPMFACQSIYIQNSKEQMFLAGMKSIRAHALGTGSTTNTSVTIPLNGDQLEVLTTVCIIESSQHNPGARSSTFGGQNGESFFINLIENLFKEHGYRRMNNVKIEYKFSSIKSFIKSIHVPFLFPSSTVLPEFFEDHLSGFQGFNNRSVDFGTYRRCRNLEQIDSFFKYYSKKGQESCSVECKNRNDNLLVGKLISIIRKAIRNKSKLSMVFCRSTAGATEETLDEFKSICIDSKWNLLKISKKKDSATGSKVFSFAPYFDELKWFPISSLTCIVFELNQINPL